MHGLNTLWNHMGQKTKYFPFILVWQRLGPCLNSPVLSVSSVWLSHDFLLVCSLLCVCWHLPDFLLSDSVSVTRDVVLYLTAWKTSQEKEWGTLCRVLQEVRQVLTPTDPDSKQDCQHTTHQTVTTCCFQHTWQMDVCCIRSLLTYLLFSANDYNIHTRNCLSVVAVPANATASRPTWDKQAVWFNTT